MMLQTYKQQKKEKKNNPSNNEEENLDVFEKSQKISDDWFSRTAGKDAKNNENKDSDKK